MFVCYIFFAEELTDLVHNMQASEQVICQVWPALVAANEAGSDLTEMITEYTREVQTGRKLLKTLINIYEAEWFLQIICQAINRSFATNDHMVQNPPC